MFSNKYIIFVLVSTYFSEHITHIPYVISSHFIFWFSILSEIIYSINRGHIVGSKKFFSQSLTHIYILYLIPEVSEVA